MSEYTWLLRPFPRRLLEKRRFGFEGQSPLCEDLVRLFRPLPTEVGRPRAPQRRPRGWRPFCVVVLAEGLSTPPTSPAFRRLVHQCRVALCHVKVAMLAGQRSLICTPLFILRGSLRGTRDSEGLQPVSHFSSNCTGGK